MRIRTLTSILLLLVILPIVWIGGLPLVGLIYIMSFISLHELLRMKNIHILSLPGIFAMIALGILIYPDIHEWITVETQVKALIFMSFIILSFTVVSKNQFNFIDASFCMLSVAYIGIGHMYFYQTREAGIMFILFAFFIVWSTDTGAYLIGKMLGKHKLWPQISPNKTIEGFVGGIIICLLVSLIFFFQFNLHDNLLIFLAISTVLSMFGQLGDLVESALKRHFDVKDSGSILPGHGGLLDRFDSFIFVLPLMNILPLIS